MVEKKSTAPTTDVRTSWLLTTWRDARGSSLGVVLDRSDGPIVRCAHARCAIAEPDPSGDLDGDRIDSEEVRTTRLKRGQGGQMGILSWIVVGAIAGVIAKLLMPGRDPGGCIITILLGILGAIVGGFLVGLVVGGDVVTGINVPTIVVAVFGAILLLALYRVFVGRRSWSG